MVALFALLLVAAVVLGFLGVLLKGLFWLLVIGIVVFVIDLGVTAFRLGRHRRLRLRGRRSLR
jgi:hypothetical protein